MSGGLGRAIEILRAEQGLTRDELATLAGISPTHLAAIEAGDEKPASRALSSLARALEITEADLASLANTHAGARDDERPSEERDPAAATPPKKRVRSFVMPLMGGEWEATPQAPPRADEDEG